MSDDPSRPVDMKAVWKGQPREIPPMVLEQVHADAVRNQGRRRRGMITEILAALVVIVVFGLYVRFLPGALLKTASGLAILWAVFYIWRWVRLFGPRRVPDDAVACLDFHRSELEQQRDAARGMWRWTLAPLVPVFILFGVGRWIGPAPPWRAIWLDHLIIVVTSVLLVESLVLMWLWTRRRADVWQDQIDELDILKKETL